ncbi:ABC transporter permease [Mesorhizobium tianshanense]|uniref:Putative spermidine/putrescine transport system permease protein n=1 Tax=Mesorhizobium tianshanense TaxID=39844 RepID=A0A562MVB2_9HYPH|nr:ABC transporter permease [Mesorhizobium tianshanense]TWI23758.1 putative spermidine/putrescine transport system permease protein [Mesorhizobium tianshanense]GLS37432.1 ABC transporter permease [Mesorhizobium tianshanense]
MHGYFAVRSALRARLGAIALVAPLMCFVLFFFFWPLATMMQAAVTDGTVRGVLPETAAALSDWDGESGPTAAMQAALIADLRAPAQQMDFGDAVRRLNSEISGFRSLMSRTATAVRGAPEGSTLTLVGIDQRWGDPKYWQAIRRAMPLYTDRNLLAAVDLTRDARGHIAQAEGGASANRQILTRTFVISAAVTLLCAAIGLPYAMIIAASGGWVRTLLLIAVLLPLWTSLLVRTAAWFILLQNEGIINDTLIALGLTDAPVQLIFNRTGVVIAMTHVLLPFMVLPIYSGLLAIPNNLLPAAASLGATRLQAFRHVLLPLAFPSLMSGCLLVFMVALGYYITPALVGGAEEQMISSVIAFFATGTANWGMAGALGFILLAVTTLLYFVYGRLSRSPTMMIN